MNRPLTKHLCTLCRCLLVLLSVVPIISASASATGNVGSREGPAVGPTYYRVAFLGYVVSGGSGRGKNVSAVLQVEGPSAGRPKRWRVTRSPDDCGGKHNVDYFDAAEFGWGQEGAPSDQSDDDRHVSTVQVLLPEERYPWATDAPLFLCLATETYALGRPFVRWLPLGRSTLFALAPLADDVVLNGEADSSDLRGKFSSTGQGPAQCAT